MKGPGQGKVERVSGHQQGMIEVNGIGQGGERGDMVRTRESEALSGQKHGRKEGVSELRQGDERLKVVWENSMLVDREDGGECVWPG